MRWRARVALECDSKAFIAGRGTLAYGYDPLGRKTTMRQGAATGPLRALWELRHGVRPGAPAVNGQLAKSTRFEPAGSGNAYVSETVGFNADSSPSAARVIVPAAEIGLAGTYTYYHTYWQDGSLSSTGLPDVDGVGNGLLGESLDLKYNHLGLPDSVETSLGTGGAYVLGTTYTRFGEPTLVGTDGPDASGYDQITHYEEGTHRVKRIVVSKPTAPSGIADLNLSAPRSGRPSSVVIKRPASPTCITKTGPLGEGSSR